MERRLAFDGGVASEVAVDGPPLVVAVPTAAVGSVGTIAWPATIAASGNFTSPLIPTSGMPHVAVGGTLSQAGTIVIQPYLDGAGLLANGAPSTLVLAAGVEGVLDVNFGKVVGAFTVEIVNGAAAVASLTNFAAFIAAR